MERETPLPPRKFGERACRTFQQGDILKSHVQFYGWARNDKGTGSHQRRKQRNLSARYEISLDYPALLAHSHCFYSNISCTSLASDPFQTRSWKPCKSWNRVPWIAKLFDKYHRHNVHARLPFIFNIYFKHINDASFKLRKEITFPWSLHGIFIFFYKICNLFKLRRAELRHWHYN